MKVFKNKNFLHLARSLNFFEENKAICHYKIYEICLVILQGNLMNFWVKKAVIELCFFS